MSVLLETSLGDLVVDLDVERCPRTCENFIKLCKSFRYNYLTFFSVQKDFLAQTGDPTNSGQGGQSIWSTLDPSSADYTETPFFEPERRADAKHAKRGTLSMACRKIKDGNSTRFVAGSQFFITLTTKETEWLDERHAPFGWIVEGDEQGGALDEINATHVDKDHRPLRDIRIDHVVVLDDPFPDPEGLRMPSRTPSPTPEQLKPIGLDAKAEIDDQLGVTEAEEQQRKRDQNTAALTLEMVGDLPYADIRPPENILFVCKLNPITQSDDLHLIFSRFGDIRSCEVIRDRRTGDSLQYAFIEYDRREDAEQAYFKMQNVLIDDRRIWVDFSQSVSKLSKQWRDGRKSGNRHGQSIDTRKREYIDERRNERDRHEKRFKIQ